MINTFLVDRLDSLSYVLNSSCFIFLLFLYLVVVPVVVCVHINILTINSILKFKALHDIKYT